MLKRDGFYDRVRQAPDAEQVSADLRMRCAEHFLLGLMHGDLAALCKRLRPLQILRAFLSHYPVAEVMQQPGEKGVIRDRRSLRQRVRYHRHFLGVLL